MRQRLGEITDALSGDERSDRYGGGELLESFEREIAGMLGKEAAVFMPSGTMAQQIALRVHSERSGNPNVAIHPQSHLMLSEADAFQTLHPLHGVRVGERGRLYTRGDLEAANPLPGAMLLELPERNIGGALRPWSELCDIAAWARPGEARESPQQQIVGNTHRRKHSTPLWRMCQSGTCDFVRIKPGNVLST